MEGGEGTRKAGVFEVGRDVREARSGMEQISRILNAVSERQEEIREKQGRRGEASLPFKG